MPIVVPEVTGAVVLGVLALMLMRHRALVRRRWGAVDEARAAENSRPYVHIEVRRGERA
jgi:hypothetical protein